MKVSSIDFMLIKGIHHVAIICSDYQKSKDFYTRILGFSIVSEVYRETRRSYKLNLAIDADTQIELFSFPEAPPRPSYPEAQGLRHLAFAVKDLNKCVERLNSFGIKTEPIRLDEHTGKEFTFFTDPDGLPLELYQV